MSARDDALLAEMAAITKDFTAGAPIKPKPIIITASDVEPEQVRWWWRGRLALGKLTILEGDQDMGKSTVLIDLAARVSTGRPMPDGTPAPEGPGDVVLLAAAEDGLADTVAPRLLAAGAEMGRVHVWRGTPEPNGYERGFELEYDMAALEDLVVERGVRLIIVDALMGAVPAGGGVYRDPDVRRLLHPVATLAEKTGAMAIANRHFTKGSARAAHRGGGSVAFGAVARCVLGAVRDPDDESGERKLLAVTKANLLAESERQSMVYRIVGATAYRSDGQPVETSRIEWLGTDERRMAELLHRADDEEGAGLVSECARKIRALLADGPMLAKEATDDLHDVFTKATIRRARERAGVTRETGCVYQQTESGRGASGPWWWRLPEGDRDPSPGAHNPMNTRAREPGCAPGQRSATSQSPSGISGHRVNGSNPQVSRASRNEHLGVQRSETHPGDTDLERWEHLAQHDHTTTTERPLGGAG